VILKTLETRFGLAPLTARDAAASDLSGVLTLAAARTDDPLAGVKVLPLATNPPAAQAVTHLQQINAALTADLPVADPAGGAHHVAPPLGTSEEADRYIMGRTAAWAAQREGG
jgi:phospholipase C